MAVIKADSNNFSELISSGVVLVDFFATWCGPCKMIAPILDQVSEEVTDVKVIKVDVDEARAVASEYGIMSIPTLMLFKDGSKVAQLMGFQPKNALISWIEQNK